ncbi:hypothetical protein METBISCDRAFT_19693 [Metschnikowia bicuspidata]|uniref:Uncharacterized protein n=1 Tax=Metschnikowia bicuspidata TaxID=27322 RepID=A0A4P9Z8E7_9ASCO|nr:hypothetical protein METBISCDRAFT_19693 [Metschnikowia bicuspidata]
MEPAPYGGFMTRTIDEEHEQKMKLDLLRVPVEFNGHADVFRPEVIHVRGVESFATADIKNYVDYYINYECVGDAFKALADQKRYRVQWIDDSNANLVFRTHEDAVAAMRALLEDPAEQPALAPEYVAQLLTERVAKLFSQTLELKKYLLSQKQESEDLFNAKKAEKDAIEVEKLEKEGPSVVLHMRMAVRSDQKVENAAAYSRYYLLHGEPDRSRRPRQERGGDGRGQYQRDRADEGDLFLEKLASYEQWIAREEIEEDLFADRMREHSPSRNRR